MQKLPLNRQLQAVEWRNSELTILDQRYLPEVVSYHHLRTVEQVVNAIQTMQVRGAPAIGIAAAYAVVLAARHCFAQHGDGWKQTIAKQVNLLADSRPTAVNLVWALDKMSALIETIQGDPESKLLAMARQIHQDDIDANLTMGIYGADILGKCTAVLTHCNAGALATGGYGTALGVIRSACSRGLQQVYATETRPWLQGARLTVWELQQDGIASTLITDLASGYLMQQGKIDWIIVGADRIAANGDTANKIGTYALATLARQHGVKTMVVAPCSTIDWTLISGEMIAIEQRDPMELLPDSYQGDDSLVTAWNPVFDVTPAHLIDAIVTERGVVFKPDENGMKKLQSSASQESQAE
ncbi:MAG TPA: S-methyl-5-thioribose-1-phosphate isomerase [Crenotrichaceae bacterium]|nr:S-methyl-5-thioribose-1-phosphate isomerase [Crenotrichaceae bacterium]